MVKTVGLIALLLLYPLFLKWIHIHDLRVVPLVVPYAMGCICVVIILDGLAGAVRKLLRK
ncbi:hypothetical protein [Paenibacillus hamazuiensis]|uniref:hypothetical protein n=1 Tax=Paenibacillus hamazuiensis TaxID=2936508 RepID=UPI00201004D8|nr:hypothetical protein [Paenibacillus hamazuiensis]